MKHSALIVDDDKAVREALTFVLGREMNVSSADNAEAGVAALTDDDTVVVLDVKMGGQDGFWAATQMRLRFEDVPIVFHSAYQGTKDPIAVINDHRPFAFVNKGDSSSAARPR